mgnify:CR=1 FL=1
MYAILDQQGFDEAFCIEKSQYATVFEVLSRQQGVIGWCDENKRLALFHLVRATQPEKIVEIGVYGGASLLPMAAGLAENGKGMIYGVDPWNAEASLQYQTSENYSFWSQVDHPRLLAYLEYKIGELGLRDHIRLIRATSQEAAPIEEIDILHIDGNHSEEISFADVVKWAPLVKKGSGWIVFDDLDWSDGGRRTTMRAVRYLDEHCQRVAEYFEDDQQEICSWAIWRK